LTSMKHTVFIVDDDPMIRDALSLIISRESIPVSAFSNGHDFLAACSGESAGCVILDVNMPGMSGIELQHAMLDRKIWLPIIFLTGSGDISTSVKAIQAGAMNFLTKPVNSDELLASVRLAILESIEISSKNYFSTDCDSRIKRLTPRELDVMRLVIQGFQNKVIAQKLRISHRTVEIHKSKIVQKTNAINLLHLAQIARAAGFESNLVMLDELTPTSFSPTLTSQATRH